MKSIMMERPNPATNPYTASAEATPNPDTMPDFQFRLTVLWIHNMPIGPKGIETERPQAIPVHSNLISIDTKIDEKIIYMYIILNSINNTWIFGYF